MKTVARWNTTRLTATQRTELARILKLAPDDSLMDQAEIAIAEANRYRDPPATSTSAKDLKNTLTSLHSSLERMQRTLAKMDNAHILDDHYCIANGGDTSLMEIRQARQSNSGFEVVVSHLLAAVDSFQEESVVPTGKGRHPDNRYTLALLVLADYYSAAFPKRLLSANHRSKFRILAQWYLEQHGRVADAQRQIETALESWKRSQKG